MVVTAAHWWNPADLNLLDGKLSRRDIRFVIVSHASYTGAVVAPREIRALTAQYEAAHRQDTSRCPQ